MSTEPTLARPDQLRPIAEMGHRTKVIVMAGTMLGLFTSAMDQTVVGTSMPTIIADLGGFGLFSWVGTGFMLASVAADRGRREAERTSTGASRSIWRASSS